MWSPLDEALSIATRTAHLQRLWPVAVARADAGWLAGDLKPHVALLTVAADLAARTHDRIACGELGVWLRLAGRRHAAATALAAEPFASWLAGDAAGAGFERLGCP